LMDNVTEENRRVNRRIEFKILELPRWFLLKADWIGWAWKKTESVPTILDCIPSWEKMRGGCSSG
jgi:hypothetical protein